MVSLVRRPISPPMHSIPPPPGASPGSTRIPFGTKPGEYSAPPGGSQTGTTWQNTSPGNKRTILLDNFLAMMRTIESNIRKRLP